MKRHHKPQPPSSPRLFTEPERRLAASLAYFAIEHVPREQNREADRLAREALDRGVAARAAPVAEPETRKPKLETLPAEKRIRARWRHGALHPAEPLDLAEGEEVEIEVHKPHHD